MSTNKVVIIGGGISGIFSALLYAKKGCQVTLIEKASELGGLLRSQNLFQEQLNFDFGTHFLRQTGNEEIDQILFDDLEVKKFNYLKTGTYYKTLYNKNGFLSDENIPNRERYFEQLLKSKDNSNPQNLKEQLISDFGEGFAENVFTPIVKKLFFTNPEDLVTNSHALFGLNRICTTTSKETNRLKKEKKLDKVLAYHNYTEGISQLKSMYPVKGGVGKWMKKLEEKLNNFGVTVLKNRNIVDVTVKGDKVVSVKTETETFNLDTIVWTIPTFLLLQKIKVKLPQSRPPKRLTSTIFHFLVDKSYLTDLYYIQCYNPNFKSFRITLYDNFSKGLEAEKRITVEVLTESPPNDLIQLKAEIVKELKLMQIISEETSILNSFENVYPNGFPVLTKAFVEGSKSQVELAKATARNLEVFGKANGKTWFMGDIINDVYNKLK